MDFKTKRIYIAGSGGMVGSAIRDELARRGYGKIIVSASAELDLTDQNSVRNFFSTEKPEVVILAAAKVGGILANNTFRAEFLYDNLMIEANVIHAAFEHRVDKLIFLGSSCIYPKFAPQPMTEESLLSAPLEPTNEPYAIAKIAGIKLCENYYRQHGCNFLSVMPTNLYGPRDNFDLQSSHVIPALIRKFHEGKIAGSVNVEVWGSGTPLREFLYVEDLAEAVVFVLDELEAAELYSQGVSQLNIGSGNEITIRELAEMIKTIVGFDGYIRFDDDKPDGTPRKQLKTSRLTAMGWRSRTPLGDGLKLTYDWFLANSEHASPAQTTK